ncbi:hypothetical protein B7P43_G09744 [Cryptotermes secundus]|uniref:CCAAT/enhancer-binding protein zeta n=1 Tax=Cryptotermes secundus TaxID=105785 RepID=A0A2J7RSH9_9NEOP|nr:hypothetical protein B7P43_G09744 [Cryptotermes secundus]
MMQLHCIACCLSPLMKEIKVKHSVFLLFEFQDEEGESPQLSKDQIDRLKSEAHNLLEQEAASYNSKISKRSMKSDYNWIRTIMNKGTVADRVAAHTIAIQDSPIHTLSLLQNLVSMVKVIKKKECTMVLDTLTELFLSDLLRPDQKLREFEKCPLSLLDKYSSGNHVSRKSRLMHWYYEDRLKKLYYSFVLALNTAAQDSVERNKEKALTAMYKLLAGNPEQEALLLRNLVNKLGDPSQKVASKAIYSLIQLLQVHPNMKFVVMEETEKLLFRPNISHKAQYYGICFLSQFLLSNDEAELARSLIHIYFSFFRACVKKGEVDSRLMTALLTGVNRAYPYAKQEMEKMLEHIDTMYKVVHYASFNVSLYTLSLLFQVADFANSVSDRFYSALYKKLLDPQLATSSHQALFLSLMFKALKKDEDVHRVRVFVKRLFQICGYLPVSLVCGILYMVSQLAHMKEGLLALSIVHAGYTDDDQGEEHYEDIKLEEPEELEISQGGVHYEEKNNESVSVMASIPTWFHCENEGSRNGKQKNGSAYSPFHRNPLFAGGQYCAYTELLKLSQHFHPTITLFANNILQGEVIKYSGDPLQDFTLPKFLDRFVFKNPKKNIKEEVVRNSKFSRKRAYIPSGIRSLRVDSASYLNEDESKIPVDELFMYRYLHKKGNLSHMKEEEDGGSDASSVASEEFHEMLDGLLAGKEKDLDFAEDLGRSASEQDEGPEDINYDEEEEHEQESDSEEEADIQQEASLSGDDIISDNDLDEDAECIVFSDSESDVDISGSNKESEPKGKQKQRMEKHKKKDGKGSDVFMSAEEFSEMLDSVGASGLKLSGSSALSNRDNAGEKQLKWETERDFWFNRGKKQPGKNNNNKRKWNSRSHGKWNEKTAKRRKKK